MQILVLSEKNINEKNYSITLFRVMGAEAWGAEA